MRSDMSGLKELKKGVRPSRLGLRYVRKRKLFTGKSTDVENSYGTVRGLHFWACFAEFTELPGKLRFRSPAPADNSQKGHAG